MMTLWQHENGIEGNKRKLNRIVQFSETFGAEGPSCVWLNSCRIPLIKISHCSGPEDDFFDDGFPQEVEVSCRQTCPDAIAGKGSSPQTSLCRSRTTFGYNEPSRYLE